MKRAKKTMSAGLLAIGVIGVTSIAQARPDAGYEYLICRGGDSLALNIGAQRGNTTIGLGFRAGPNGWKAGGRELQPGQCTWVDRAMSWKEPRKLTFTVPSDVNTSVNWKSFLIPGRPVSRRRAPVVIGVDSSVKGVSLRLQQVEVSSRGHNYTDIMTIDLSSDSYVTFSVKSLGNIFHANRVTRGAITGETAVILTNRDQPILNNKASNRCLTMPATAISGREGRAQVNACTSATGVFDPQHKQKWLIRESSDNIFSIRSLRGNWCVNHKASVDNYEGGPVKLVGCSNHADQQWERSENRRNQFRLRNVSSGKCLNVHGREHKNWGKISVYTCADTPDQTWSRR